MTRVLLSQENSSLSLLFYDVNRVDDPLFWAGTSAHIIHHLRQFGHVVTVVGNNIPVIRRILLALIYHFYRVFHTLHYHPDRDVLLTRLYTVVGSRKLRRHPEAEAILTVSAAFTAFLETSKPIFILLDATWGQIVETYPYFYASKQPRRIVRGGFILDRMAFRRPNVHLVMTSLWAAERAIKDYDLEPRRVHVLPFGANLDHEPSRDDLGLAINRRSVTHCHLLFVGREFERKGGPLALEITALLISYGIPATLHIVGCSPSSLPSFATSYGLLRKHVAAERSLLDGLYRTSNFFLMPSRGEAQGIVFNEAAAYALPVAACDVGGISAIVKHNVWGFLAASSAGPAEYAAWIRALFYDRPQYIAMAWSARDDYEDRLSGSAYAESLSSLIRNVL